jgi:crossover junction endodeoxyribonuclease RuvC
VSVKVLGVDPGTAVLGYGIVESAAGLPGRLVECGILATRARDPLPARLRVIHEGITELIARHRPDVVAVEAAFYGRNVRTTMVLCHARGVILLAAEEAAVPIVEYTPAMVKKAIVGRGAALKPQVGYMVAQLLRLREAPAPADAADGVAIALTHLMLAGRAPRLAAASAGR